MTKEKQTAVQAGGNCGIFPRHMALFFKEVYTFEPFPVNFHCLQLNCIDKNVFAFNYALGEKPGKTRVSRYHGRSPVKQSKNCGDVRTGDKGEEVQMMTIDGLKLKACDLIYLDTQGDELFILRGAIKTLREFHPVLGLEWAPKVMKYKDQEKDTEAFLQEEGYKPVLKGKDRLYVWNV